MMDSTQSEHLELRQNLAATFRWAARLNMHEGIANHFSAAASPDGSRFLMNPYGRHWSTICASDLLLLDAAQPPNSIGVSVDPTAWAIHGAIHRNRPEARCVMHLHSKFATVLACLQDPILPPIDQNTMRFYKRISVDPGYDGMGLGEEAERLSACLEGKPILVMGNHGVLAAAETVAQAFDTIYYFERACETYITALSTGRPLNPVSDEVAEKTARQWEDYGDFPDRHLAAIRVILDRDEPEYRN